MFVVSNNLLSVNLFTKFFFKNFESLGYGNVNNKFSSIKSTLFKNFRNFEHNYASARLTPLEVSHFILSSALILNLFFFFTYLKLFYRNLPSRIYLNFTGRQRITSERIHQRFWCWRTHKII